MPIFVQRETHTPESGFDAGIRITLTIEKPYDPELALACLAIWENAYRVVLNEENVHEIDFEDESVDTDEVFGAEVQS